MNQLPLPDMKPTLQDFAAAGSWGKTAGSHAGLLKTNAA
jgi:hypothetical protein